jgi:flavorubredoxin
MSVKALVVYESMYGNTRAVAEAIARGLGNSADVTLAAVGHVSDELVREAELLVVGGPTHVHSMSRASTRKAAVEAAHKPDSGLVVEDGAGGQGLREWFVGVQELNLRAAAFDTRVQGPVVLMGRASRGIERSLRKRGANMAAESESFLVSKGNRLLIGELKRAEGWGAQLGADAVVLARV